MKRRIYGVMVFLLVFAAAFSVMQPITAPTAYAAAEPALNYSKKTIIIGTTYTLKVVNVTDSKATYSWSTSDSSVAAVNGKGKVTPKKAGTAKITCKITYSDRTTKSVSCTVTAKERVVATGVEINNAKIGDMNAHVMTVGEEYDFNRTLTPSTSTDSTYWVIADEEYAQVDSSGVVTALKAGITRLEARTSVNKTEALKAENTITDSIYLYILPDSEGSGEGQNPSAAPSATPVPGGTAATPTPTPRPTVTATPTPGADQAVIKSVGLTGSKELSIAFGAPVLESSVIGVDGYLTSAVSITAKNSSAAVVGVLTPTLSSDGRTLTIRSSSSFDGTYVILISGIRTEKGETFSSYSRELALKDTTGPSVVGNTELDAAGYRNTIRFSEELDLSDLTVLGVDTSVSESTKALLLDRNMYSLSEDQTAIVVNLSGIYESSDLNKEIVVTLNYIKDAAGNYTTPTFLKIKLYTDTSLKAPSVPLSVERTSVSTLTVTFDREVQYEGFLTIGGEMFYGTKDTEDPRKVIYQIGSSYYAQSLTGTQKVTVSNWYSYHSSVNTGTLSQDFMVDFTISAQPPKLQTKTLYSTVVNDASVINLVLTYDKNVLVSNPNGAINVTLYDSYGNILQKNVSYQAKVRSETVTLELDQQMSPAGTYVIELPAGFVFDGYMNFSAAENFVVTKQNDTAGSSLPNPTIMQDSQDPSVLYVEFQAKLDQTSAQTVSNYLLANAIRPEKAELIAQSDSYAKVRLTFASGAIEYDTNYVIRVSGIKGYGSSGATLKQYTTEIYLRENKAPIFQSAKIIGTNMIELTFHDNTMLMGTPVFNVTVNGKVISSNAWCSGTSVYITVYESIGTGYATISPGYGNEITDINGNIAAVPDVFTAVRAY
ncbi:MAG: Ig-like domain-containing protein [Lachnospiraceae bacterium]|nr:Ig-like domain-containing protein [Lachnospiraceae bacterium]